jgi:DNA repair exonuclease SbcCD ATPase subunit
MRSCRHCAHENADHLAFCSQCGRKLPRTDGGLPVLRLGQGRTTSDSSAAYTRTVLATPGPASLTGRPTVSGGRMLAERNLAPTGPSGFGRMAAPAAPRSRVRWLGESIGYIYVYLRGKLDAGERRRRLLEERTGAEALLAGALSDLGQIVLREGVQHAELTGLLEAIGRAHARREAAAADAATSESLQQNEATRLGNQQAAAEAEWTAADKASRESEQILRAATADRRTTGTRLARVIDERERIERATNDESGPVGDARLAQLAHDAAGLAAEQRALEDNVGRLDTQLADLRAKAATLREAAAAAKSKLEQAVAGRRQAASAMAASIAGRLRDRVDAEREISDLTAQIGRVTADVRLPHAALLSAYQNIDRLTETISDRSAQLEAIEQARSHYDHRKLLAGLGLVTSMLVVISAALWKLLK